MKSTADNSAPEPGAPSSTPAGFKKISGMKIRKFEGVGETLDLRVQAIRPGRGRYETRLAECVEIGSGSNPEPFLLPLSASLEGLLTVGKVYRIIHLGMVPNERTGRTFRSFDVYESEG